MARMGSLLRADLRNLRRDPLLLGVVLVPLLLALVLRFGYPALARLLADRVELLAYSDLATAWMLVTSPLLFGFAVGFLLLDERDERVLAAIAVTPLGKRGWLLYRATLPVVWGTAAGFLVLWLGGSLTMSFARFLPVALLAALQAPSIALFLAAFAPNKVQGLALAKAIGILQIAPFAVLLDPPLRWAAGMTPQFWVAHLVGARHAPAPEYWGGAALALVVHLAWIAVLLRLFERRVE